MFTTCSPQGFRDVNRLRSRRSGSLVHFSASPKNEPDILLDNLSFVVVIQTAPPSAAQESFSERAVFLFKIWAKPKF
ncbi:MAG: hypothetical protein U5L45_22080 [Saprospiraceae bacterium]|nr:hypothetical protein [Saprospiraceae bacterium]